MEGIVKIKHSDGITILTIFLSAGLLSFSNVLLFAIPGIVEFEIADYLLSFVLPSFSGEALLDIGAKYGTFWPLTMAWIVVFGLDRRVPEKWNKSPKKYKSIYISSLVILISILLALLFHVEALIKSR